MLFRACSKMFVFICCLILFLAVISLSAFAASIPPAKHIADARIAKSYGKLPLSFVENKGQLDKRARFVIRGPRASAFFRNDGVTFDLWEVSKIKPLDKRNMKAEKPAKSEKQKHAVLKLTFKGADPKCQVKGMDTLPGKVNYMIGNDKAKWHTDVPTYKGVIYKNVWQGIDVIYRGDRRQLKYDIRVNPGADIRKVQLRYDGAQKMWLDKKGTLHIKTAVTEFIEKVPGIYQEKAGKRINVMGGYKLLDGHTVGFSVKNVDPKLPLVIDPASDLKYCTYLGGSGSEGSYGAAYSVSIAVDNQGCAYIGGHTESPDYPTTSGAYDVINEGAAVKPQPRSEACITKLNAQGTSLEYSTFIGDGGAGVINGIVGIAVDEDGYVYAAGGANPKGFPSTPGALSTPSDDYWAIFVLKLNQSGDDLVYSATFGAQSGNYPSDLAVDTKGCAYVTGMVYSDGYPTTPGAFDTSRDDYSCWFITKLNASGSAMVYSTLLGDSDEGQIYNARIKVDNAGCAYVAGRVDVANFPTTPGAFDRSHNGKGDLFVTKMNPSGTALEYSTYLGGSDDDGEYCAIALDNEGCAYVTGISSSLDFPITAGAYDTAFKGYADVFITKLDPTGSNLIFSTRLGSFDYYERPEGGIALDPEGYVYVTGFNNGGNFPITPDAFWSTISRVVGGKTVYYTGFISKFSPSGRKLLYSTYFGGTTSQLLRAVATDNEGLVYITGDVESDGLPCTPMAYDSSYNGGATDTFVAKFDITHAGLKPDLLVRLDTESSDSGAGIYSKDGNSQVKTQKALQNQTVTYVFKVANAGSVSDSFTITGTGGGSGWTVRYYDINTNADVTSQVISNGWTSGELASSTSKGIYANVTPDSSVSVGAKNTLLITATSDNIAKVDVVKAVTTLWLGYRPDLLIRAGNETTYTGLDVINTDGTNQTKSQNGTPNQKITYTFKVRNAGDSDDSFKITGPGSVAGWNVRYYESNTGAEVTSLVTGAGWPSGTLAPGATKGIFVNVKSDSTLSLGATNTLLITAASEADDSKIDVVKAVTTFTGIYKTDMLIKSGPETSYSGAGTYSTDGTNQTKLQNVCAGQKVTYGFRARNGGNAIDSFRITGPAGGSGWSVKYYDFTTNADVTSQVTGAGWISRVLAPGTIGGVFVNIKPDSTVPLGSSITLTMTGTSMSDNTKIDVVKAVTTCVASYKPDLMIKLGTETTYSGLGIINADGTNQTKSQNAAINQKVTCSFRVKNAGYLSDSFKITGPGGGSGWSVKYIDLATGADVTSQVTGTGWLSGTMAPGTDKGVYAKIMPDSTVTSGSSKTLTITAASVGNSAKIDVVKAVTTVP